MKKHHLVLGLLACGACTASHPATTEAAGGSTSYAGQIPSAVPPPDPTDASADADAGTGSGDAGDAAPPAHVPVCPSAVVFGTGTAEALPDADHAGFSITPDGLDAAWVSAGTVHHVDRSTTSGSFGAVHPIGGPVDAGRVALTSDGLGLVAVRADGGGFLTWTRASRTAAFAPAAVDPLATITLDTVAPGNTAFANPVFARGDTFLLYDVVSSTGYVTWVSTRFRTDEPFAGGAPYLDDVLGRPGTRLVVTQASYDLRTLFVWDEDAQRSHLITLTAASEVALDSSLGAMRDLQASDDCRTFWYASGSPLRIFRARAE